MSNEPHIDCKGKTLDQVMAETKRAVDAHMAETLKAVEWMAVCDGCPPHELGPFMRENRDRCMAYRDRWLTEARAQLVAARMCDQSA